MTTMQCPDQEIARLRGNIAGCRALVRRACNADSGCRYIAEHMTVKEISRTARLADRMALDLIPLLAADDASQACHDHRQ